MTTREYNVGFRAVDDTSVALLSKEEGWGAHTRVCGAFGRARLDSRSGALTRKTFVASSWSSRKVRRSLGRRVVSRPAHELVKLLRVKRVDYILTLWVLAALWNPVVRGAAVLHNLMVNGLSVNILGAIFRLLGLAVLLNLLAVKAALIDCPHLTTGPRLVFCLSCVKDKFAS